MKRWKKRLIEYVIAGVIAAILLGIIAISVPWELIWLMLETYTKG